MTWCGHCDEYVAQTLIHRWIEHRERRKREFLNDMMWGQARDVVRELGS